MISSSPSGSMCTQCELSSSRWTRAVAAMREVESVHTNAGRGAHKVGGEAGGLLLEEARGSSSRTTRTAVQSPRGRRSTPAAHPPGLRLVAIHCEPSVEAGGGEGLDELLARVEGGRQRAHELDRVARVVARPPTCRPARCRAPTPAPGAAARGPTAAPSPSPPCHQSCAPSACTGRAAADSAARSRHPPRSTSRSRRRAPRAAVSPWHRRVDEHNRQRGKPCTSRLPKESRLRREPRMPCTSTHVGGCGNRFGSKGPTGPGLPAGCRGERRARPVAVGRGSMVAVARGLGSGWAADGGSHARHEPSAREGQRRRAQERHGCHAAPREVVSDGIGWRRRAFSSDTRTCANMRKGSGQERNHRRGALEVR